MDFGGLFQDLNDVLKYPGGSRNHSGLIFNQNHIILKDNHRKFKEIDNKIYFYVKSITSIPFGGPTVLVTIAPELRQRLLGTATS